MGALLGALHSLHALSGARIGVRSELGASPFSWPRLLSWMRPIPGVYSEFIPVSSGEGAASGSAGPSLRPAAGGQAASFQRVEDVAAELSLVLKGVLGSDVGLHDPLMDAGLDSLGAVEFKSAVEARLGLTLPVTAVFDYPTLSSLAGYIHSQLGPAPDAAEGDAEVEVRPSAASSPTALSIAILSSAGRASAGLLDSALSSDGIRRVPLGRWDADLSLGDLVVFGGFINDAELFDAALFSARRTEAVLMDPQQRLLLHYSWDALLGAGVGSASMPALGVYVGISSTDYARLAAQHSGDLSAFTATGSALSVAAGRLSFTYGAQGPCMSIDTACSSSLVGAHVARVGLLGGESRSAIVAGVNVTLDIFTTLSFARAQMLAPDGRCKTLDASADGYVRGEAVAAVVLRASPVGSSSGHVHLLVGSAVNQDGRSSSLTAPNGPAQQAVVRAALLGGSLAPGALGDLQLHGTGTALGDPIEVGE